MAETIRYDRGADGVVVLTLDDPSRGANTMNAAFLSSLDAVLDRLEAEKDDVTGVIVTSAKKTWFAGGDLDMLGSIGADQAAEAYAAGMRVKAQLRRLETLGRPVVAAINGSALGGGLELALACHHRIVADDRKIEIGFPEVTLGLLPGGGGVVRTVRLLGITEALMQVLLKGQRHKPAKAQEVGLVHEVAPAGELEDRARVWIAANPNAVQPWDAKGYRIPGGAPSDPRFAVNLPAFPATLRKELKGAPYPAPRNILAAAVEGAQVDLATAFDIEARYFTELATGQIAKNMIQAFFFDLQAANARGSAAKPFTKVAVLGAGMMGAGIAYVCARAGMQVLLKDVTVEAAQQGKAYSERLVQKGRGGPDLLERITPTADPADLAGADLVIEAVFEDPALKHKVFAEIEHVVSPGALLCSNTSTLPISLLADGVQRREDFVGLHFFSPVDKMPLVEIIRGQATTDETVERALGVVRQLRKTPIVVNDSRGFFTSRVIGTFTNEGIAMLAEGIAPASIEQASLQAGYPAPVLQLMDELTLTLPRRIRQETAAAVVAAGGTWTPHPADAVIDRMIDEFGRPGRSGGAGFYEYVDGRRTRLWPGLRFTEEHRTVPFIDLQERMLFAEALESVKCL
ncbi:3-hydroxyacyl-CoA dehydrogenase NAD-binding domain-containing protein, partial [Dactylosporangium sp. NPDC005572]|uniref:3-hydroxyacyl-CoA dehydrogenase NAD-binding domain-containing protein n=1 Tax=Dactylosporangium sp. NPDC005572 TaxID=3156889 RepID=UPI0033B6C4F1